jgi:Ni/Co efflux regulator RcnB
MSKLITTLVAAAFAAVSFTAIAADAPKGEMSKAETPKKAEKPKKAAKAKKEKKEKKAAKKAEDKK